MAKGKGKLQEVRAVVEFDRLAKYRLADVFVQLVPIPKRLLRAPIKKWLENQPVLGKELPQRERA